MINLVILEIVKSEKYHYFGKLEKLKISKIITSEIFPFFNLNYYFLKLKLS